MYSFLDKASSSVNEKDSISCMLYKSNFLLFQTVKQKLATATKLDARGRVYQYTCAIFVKCQTMAPLVVPLS